MLKALGAVQAVSNRGRDQRVSEQKGTTEAAGQIRNGRSPVPSYTGQSPGLSAPSPSTMVRITVLLAFFLSWSGLH